MSWKDLFLGKKATRRETECERREEGGKELEDTRESVRTEKTKEGDKNALEQVAPKEEGILDMVIAFDTTGSMAAYIGAVRQEVMDLVPRLFKDNDNLRLGIVAFGDYCDMNNKQDFGDAYQCLMPTANENEIIRFIRNSKDTGGGDGDEFYELVIKKIVEETTWREEAKKVILLISDAEPHPLGYTYKDYVTGNQIDWREEARKAADRMIQIDTVSITDAPWYKELSEMTNGIHAPFASGYKTARLVEAATLARGSEKARMMFDKMKGACADAEMEAVYARYEKERYWKERMAEKERTERERMEAESQKKGEA